MKDLLNRMAYRMAAFMRGRNGMDACARWALGAALALTLLDSLLASGVLSMLGLACMAYSAFRCCSRNIASRALENARFERAMEKPRQRWRRLGTRWTNRKSTKYLKCGRCGQSLSVPKGRGRLRVTCPKCHAQMEIDS